MQFVCITRKRFDSEERFDIQERFDSEGELGRPCHTRPAGQAKEVNHGRLAMVGIAAMALLPPMKLKTDRTLGRLVIRVSHARVIVTTNLHPSVWREAATHLEVGFAALARVPSGLGAVQVQGPRFKAALSPRAIFPTPTGSPKCLSMRRTPAAGALYCLPRRRELSCGFRCPRASCHFAFQAPL